MGGGPTASKAGRRDDGLPNPKPSKISRCNAPDASTPKILVVSAAQLAAGGVGF